ncbi:hypothetical protein ABPG75_004998 [Micractinium tetrahymenae]
MGSFTARQVPHKQRAATEQAWPAPTSAPPLALSPAAEAAPTPLLAAPVPQGPQTPRMPRVSSLAASLLKLGAAWGAPAQQQQRPGMRRYQHAASTLAVQSAEELEDVAASMVLCEAIYRADDFGTDKAEVAILRLRQQVPAAPRLQGVQWSTAGSEQQYVVAESDDAIFIAFLGTKRPADHLINLRLRHAPLLGRAGSWPGNWSGSSLGRSLSSASLSSLDSEGSGGWGEGEGEGGAPEGAASFTQAAAHSGYLRRAASIPAEQLYQLARVQGKRLVLAGHSLGGAVATLCAIRLLDALPEALHHTITCVGFAVPPVGNAALAAAAAAAGWSQRITNYLLPEDWVPGLLGMFARQQGGGSGAGSSSSDEPSADEAHERQQPQQQEPEEQESQQQESQQQRRRRRQPLRPDVLLGLLLSAVATLTSAMLGGAGTRLLTALASLPQFLPQFSHVGRQVKLPPGPIGRAAAAAGASLDRAARQHRRGARHGGGLRASQQPHSHDPLVPSHVSGRLAAHRMVSYRLRITGLYAVAAAGAVAGAV